MRAVSEAAAKLIVHTLKTVELAVRGPKASGADERGKVRRSGFFHGGVDGWFAHGGDEAHGSLGERLEVCGDVLGDRPSIRKPSGVPIADNCVLATLRRIPPAPLWCAIRKLPSEQEDILGFRSCSYFLSQAD